MRRTSIFVALAVLCYLARSSGAAPLVITSNDFNSFANAVENAPSGTTISFDLGANSTINFTSPIVINSNLTFVGNNAVWFDGGGQSSFFEIPDTASASFSGFTFQNGTAANDLNGGAIVALGQVTVTNSTFYHNSAHNDGGAIAGNMVVSNSTFLDNSAGNAGAALFTAGGPNSIPAQMTVENCTFTGNFGSSVGGVINASNVSATLRNDTIYGNASEVLAGGGPLVIQSSLISEIPVNGLMPSYSLNTTGITAPGNLLVQNSLIGDSQSNGLLNGVNGNIVGVGGFIPENPVGFPINDLLGPLTNNGGPTETMMLLDLNSRMNPAIGKGSNPDSLLNDQRGEPFLRTSPRGVDIGAYERQTPEPSAVVMALIAAICLAALSRIRTVTRAMVIISAVSTIAFAMTSQAAVLLDQSVVPAPGAGETSLSNEDYLAQTFTVGVAGQLDHIDVEFRQLVPSSGDLLLDLRPTVGGVPLQNDSLVLATAQLDPSLLPVFPPNDTFAWVTFDVSSAHIAVTPGEVLAIIAHPMPFAGQFEWAGTSTSGYSGGNSYHRDGTLGTWVLFPAPNYQNAFQTFVRTPEPKSFVIAVLAALGLPLLIRR